MTVKYVQTTYHRGLLPFVPGQIANGRKCQIESANLIVSATYTRTNLPFGRAVGAVSAPANYGGSPWRLGQHACAYHYTTSGTGASRAVTNFWGVAVKNAALPGAPSQVQGAPEGTIRVVDTYAQNDIVSVGSEGDFVVVCDSPVSIRTPVTLNLSTAANTRENYGTFSGEPAGTTGSGANAVVRGSVAGCIFISDSEQVTPYGGGDAVHLALLRVRDQPR